MSFRTPELMDVTPKKRKTLQSSPLIQSEPTLPFKYDEIDGFESKVHDLGRLPVLDKSILNVRCEVAPVEKLASMRKTKSFD